MDLIEVTAPVLVPPAMLFQQQAFDRLREALVTPPVLALPRSGRTYVVDKKACRTQVSAALIQKQHDVKLQPVAFIGRRLERNALLSGIT